MEKQSQYVLQMENGERTLLAMMEKSLFGGECSLSEEEQLAALEESRKQAVFCLAAQSASLTGEACDRIKKQSLSAIRRNMDILLQHQYLHELMTKAGIPYVVLKGAVSAYYYPLPHQRMMGDVDFLVAEDDVERAMELLIGEGFTRCSIEEPCHIILNKGNLYFELHFALGGVPNGEAGRLVREYLEDIIPTAKTVRSGPVTFRNPEPFYHGLIMLLHMRHHLLAEGMGLRHLCDWAVFVDHFSDDEFQAMFEEKLKKTGLWRFAVTVSLSAHLAIGLPYREFMGDERDLAWELLLDIITGGNFGRKAQGRVSEGVIISHYSQEGVGRGRLAPLISMANRIVYKHWPVTQKVKLLLPFGWLYWGGLRLVREIAGTREPMQYAKAYRDSQPRTELYRRLQLFETEES